MSSLQLLMSATFVFFRLGLIKNIFSCKLNDYEETLACIQPAILKVCKCLIISHIIAY